MRPAFEDSPDDTPLPILRGGIDAVGEQRSERELIQLAGSVQPHVLHLERLLKQPVAELGGDIRARIRQVCPETVHLAEPAPLRCQLQLEGYIRDFEGTLHRVNGTVLLIEIEPVGTAHTRIETVDIPGAQLRELLSAAVQRFSAASAIGPLADGVVRCFRDMLGYDRVMVYKFDPDGHGKIIAEARDPRLDSLLGHHYPATDIPQRARELYLRNRVRVLGDVNYEAQPLVPLPRPDSGAPLDMSLCHLRSMSPLHLQY